MPSYRDVFNKPGPGWYRLPADWARGRREGLRQRELAVHLSARGVDIDPAQPALSNIVGAVAQHAFAVGFDYPEPAWDGAPDDGWDCPTPLGRVDVKGCKARPHFMGVVEEGLSKGTADYYAQVWCPEDEPDAWLTRWCPTATVLGFPRCRNCTVPEHLDQEVEHVIVGRRVPHTAMWPGASLAWVLKRLGHG